MEDTVIGSVFVRCVFRDNVNAQFMGLKEQNVGLRDDISHDNLQYYILQLRKEQHCRQHVNAVITIFHLCGVHVYMAF